MQVTWITILVIIIVSIIIIIGILVIIRYCYYIYREKLRVMDQTMLDYDHMYSKILDKLPIHKFLIEQIEKFKYKNIKVSIIEENFIELINKHAHTLCMFDHNQEMVIDIIIKHMNLFINYTNSITTIVYKCLPITIENNKIIDIDPLKHGFVWCKILQVPDFSIVIQNILHTYPLLQRALAETFDINHNKAYSLALPEYQVLFQNHSLNIPKLFNRYELLEELPIQSIYPITSTIYQAIDHNNDKQLVQLMFINDHYFYHKEIQYFTDPIYNWIKNSKYILNLIDFYSFNQNPYIFEELDLFNIQSYPYLLVYPLPSFNLQEYMLRLQYKLEDVKKITYEICQCLYYIHEKGYTFGHLIPANIVYINNRFVLSNIFYLQPNNEIVRNIYHSAYLPPEYIIQKLVNNKQQNKSHIEYQMFENDHRENYSHSTTPIKSSSHLQSHTQNSSSATTSTHNNNNNQTNHHNNHYTNYHTNNNDDVITTTNNRNNTTTSIITPSLIPVATPTQDIWALGMILYQLITNKTWFHCDTYYNIVDQLSYYQLFYFTKEYQYSILLQLDNKLIISLLSQMLYKDSIKRILPKNILLHPFLNNINVIVKSSIDEINIKQDNDSIDNMKDIIEDNTNYNNSIMNNNDMFNKYKDEANYLANDNTEMKFDGYQTVDLANAFNDPNKTNNSCSTTTTNNNNNINKSDHITNNNLIDNVEHISSNIDTPMVMNKKDNSIALNYIDKLDINNLSEANNDNNTNNNDNNSYNNNINDNNSNIDNNNNNLIPNLDTNINTTATIDPFSYPITTTATGTITIKKDEQHCVLKPIIYRSIEEQGEYDVYLCYRSSSDLEHSRIIYETLVAKGIKVCYHTNCLDNAYFQGIRKSRIFIPIYSRGAINDTSFFHACNNITRLTCESVIDMFLYEQRIAIELQLRNVIDRIYPIMLGDYNQFIYAYSNYKESNCHPNIEHLKNVIINSMEYAFINELDQYHFGIPITYQMSVKDIIDNILSNQSCYPEGDSVYVLNTIVNSIIELVNDLPNVTYI